MILDTEVRSEWIGEINEEDFERRFCERGLSEDKAVDRTKLLSSTKDVKQGIVKGGPEDVDTVKTIERAEYDVTY